MPAREARLFLVSGRVQGVGFRAATRREALRLGLDGLARNLADGRVEVLAEGDHAALGELARWLRRGPPLAAVIDVEEQPAELQDCRGFGVG